MKKRKRYLLFILLLFSSKVILAQQEPQFTQYMFNGLVLNPAYAGSQGVMNITGSWRRQWVSIADAPSTQTLSVHAPTKNNRVAWGGMAVLDRINIHTNFRLFGMFAYKIPFKNGNISMGLQAGLLQQNSNYTQLNFQQQQDPNFFEDYSEMFPEIGAGIYYSSDKFYIGLSTPKLTGNLFSNDPRRLDNERHLYLTTGHVFRVSEIVQLHPSILIKSISGNAISYDINLNTVLNDVIWAGISVRSFSAINVLLQLQLNQQLRLGYAYDTQFTGFSQVRNASHEIMLNYFFNFRKEKVISPRIF